MGIFGKLFGKKKKEEGYWDKMARDTEEMSRSEKEAMEKEELNETIKTLIIIYSSYEARYPLALGNYLAGKIDACRAVESYLRGEKRYTLDHLRNLKEYDETRLGDKFNRGRWEVLSWALSRLESEVK